MLNLLVCDGNTQAQNQRILDMDDIPYAVQYANLLENLHDKVTASIVHPSHIDVKAHANDAWMQSHDLNDYDGFV